MDQTKNSPGPLPACWLGRVYRPVAPDLPALDPRGLTYHEAGHAIVGLATGRQIHRAVVGPDRGFVEPVRPARASPTSLFDDPGRLAPGHAVMIALFGAAGRAAELLLDDAWPTGPLQLGEKDHRIVATAMWRGFGVTGGYFAQHNAQHLCALAWHALERVAGALQDREELTGADVVALCDHDLSTARAYVLDLLADIHAEFPDRSTGPTDCAEPIAALDPT